MRKLPLPAATALAFAACASAAAPRQPRPARSNPDVITAEEVAAVHVQTAYDAVSRLRPVFLMTQGSSTRPHPVQVVVDNVPRGGVRVLRSIEAVDVVDIRRVSAADATMRWGTGYSGGAIVVRTSASARR